MALVLAPEPPLDAWITALDAQMARSPGFFAARPVVVDLGALAPDTPDVAGFLGALAAKGIEIIGTEGAHPAWQGVARWGRPLLVGGRSNATPPAVEREAPTAAPPPRVLAEPAEPAENLTRVIDQPVRSGQSVVFERGDLTILGSVASGAEVMAGGSIHIYGTLRGRAVAGLAGNPKARIFCRRLQAELLAIDGVYQTADDMPPVIVGKAAQAWLDGERMRIAPLD
jgi:septum site-determining protein MinC